MRKRKFKHPFREQINPKEKVQPKPLRVWKTRKPRKQRRKRDR